MTFPFLGLAAELRNRIYEYVAVGDGEPVSISRSTTSSGNFAALSRTCKAIRSEYRPIQRREARIRILWTDLQRFQNVFMHSQADLETPFRLLAIMLPPVEHDYKKVDVLPLFLTQALHPSSEFVFEQPVTPEMLVNAPKFDATDADIECVNLSVMLDHFKDRDTWREDLLSGRFASIIIRREQSVRINFKRGREPPGLESWLMADSAEMLRYERVYYDIREAWGFCHGDFIDLEWGLELGIAD